MSNWITPKQNWALDDGVLLSDMNRIEGNINFLLNTYQLPGYEFFTGAYTLVEYIYHRLSIISVVVPNGFSLKLLRASYFASEVNFRLRVSVTVGGTSYHWVSSDSTNEAFPNFTFYSNITGSNVTAIISIWYFNSSSGTVEFENLAVGCLAQISKETTV